MARVDKKPLFKGEAELRPQAAACVYVFRAEAARKDASWLTEGLTSQNIFPHSARDVKGVRLACQNRPCERYNLSD